MKKIGHVPYGPYEALIKRPLDCFLAGCALIFFSPLMGIIALLVRIKIGSPILFTQQRPGLNEKEFKILKYRTMTNQCNAKGELLPDEVRLTSFGKMLRSTSLDELPELINIVKGEMSIVGPRPLLTTYLPYYTEKEHHRHDVRPGLTGYAQIHGRNAVSWGEKFKMDVQYVDHITFLGDMKIILNTILKVLRKDGISSPTSATMESFIDYAKKRNSG